MKNRKYSKEEIREMAEKYKRVNENKKQIDDARNFINEVVEVCEDFFQLNKYK